MSFSLLVCYSFRFAFIRVNPRLNFKMRTCLNPARFESLLRFN